MAGIADTLGGRLIVAVFEKAYTVLGKYVVLKKDEELFKEWMKKVYHASSKQAITDNYIIKMIILSL